MARKSDPPPKKSRGSAGKATPKARKVDDKTPAAAAPSTAKRNAPRKPPAKRKPTSPPKTRHGSSTVEHSPDKREDAGSTPSRATTKAAKAREARGVAKRLLDAKAAPDRDPRDAEGLTPMEREFVNRYTTNGRNATQAYLAAVPGVTLKSAATLGWKLLRKVEVKAAIKRINDETINNLSTTREELIGRLVAIATADPRELVELHTGACENCFGFGNDDANKAPPGFWRNEPDPDCKVCGGDGHPREFFRDTRHLSPQAAALYAGVKRTKEGLQMLMHDPQVAIEKLNKILGLYELDNKQKQTPLVEALAGFVAGIHETGSRLPIAAPRQDKQQAVPPAPRSAP